MKLKIPIKGIEGELIKNTLVIKSKNHFKVLSSAVLNGGLRYAKAIINHRVLKRFDISEAPEIIKKVALSLNLNPKEVIGLMTGADVKKVAIVSKSYKKLVVSSIVTAGVSNAATAGDSLRNSFKFNPSTINIIVLVNTSLSESCLVNAIQTITEAKCMALKDLDIRSNFSKEIASGTTTDAIALATIGNEKRIDYAGTATKLGELIGKSVRNAVKNAIIIQERLLPNRPLVQRLKERGINFKDLIDTVMELYLNDSSITSKKRMEKVLKKEFKKAFSDLNIASLIIAGLRLEEDRKSGLIPGLNPRIPNEDSILIVDRILGASISNYMAGTKGIFEYIKLNEMKKGLVKKLSPFIANILCGVIAGISFNMHLKLSRS